MAAADDSARFASIATAPGNIHHLRNRGNKEISPPEKPVNITMHCFHRIGKSVNWEYCGFEGKPP
jgi:hypothetical protein